MASSHRLLQRTLLSRHALGLSWNGCAWAVSCSCSRIGGSQGRTSSSSSSSQQPANSKFSLAGMLGFAAAAGGLSWLTTAAADSQVAPARAKGQQAASKAATAAANAPKQQQQQQQQLPEYTREEVSKHKTAKDRIWVTYKDGVYDITDFIAQHPGGAAKIMLAAGGSVEPFWGLYQQHQKPEVQVILRQYRIGSLKGGAPAAPATADPYQHEPSRHPALMVRSDKPYNAETPAELLVVSATTPNDMFFVRHHLPVPAMDSKKFTLKVEGAGLRSVQLSLPQLQQQFKKAEVVATVQCTGNRRSEMKAVAAPGGTGHEIKGLDWAAGAIGTAVWGGVKLRDVLLAAGLRPDDPSVEHIHFIGADSDMSGTAYAASIPVSKAMAETGDVLLAWEMNGQPLSADHGGPLRVVVPGATGARWVKWLGHIVASAEECQGHWQQRDYKTFSPGSDWDNLDWSASPAIQEMPVVSAICEPANGQKISSYEAELVAKGYAWSGGGQDITRVDVSADGGKTWTPAKLQKLPHSKPGRAWAWTLWEATIPLPQDYEGQLQLTCKATDQSCNTQPETVESVWNIRGLANNAWHKVTVDVTPDAE